MAEALHELLLQAAERPDTGLRFLDRSERASWYSWAAVHERAHDACARIQGAGVRPRDRVALVYPTSIGFFDAFFGTLFAGAVPVPLYPPVRLGRIDEYHRQTAAMLQAVGARLVLADRRVRRVLGRSMELARPELGCRALDELSAGARTPVRGRESDLGLIQFSSGTTGTPKPVALSHRALLAQTSVIESYFPPSPGFPETGVSWLPLYHDMGLIGCVFPALRRPGSLTLLGPETFVARPATWLRAISRWGGSISPAPGFAYGLCVDKIRDAELEGVDLSCWRAALNGAEPVSAAVMKRFIARFAPWGFRSEAFTPVYGLSEAALAVTFSEPFLPYRGLRLHRDRLADGVAEDAADGCEIVSVGRPVPGFEVRIAGEGTRSLREDRVGRVQVRGSSLMEGYFEDSEATREVMQDGWLETGDLGFLRDGELYLCGRAKDVLILNGRKYAPELVESVVDAVPGARRGCVAALSALAEGGASEALLLFVEHARRASAAHRDALPARCARRVLAETGLACDSVVVLAPGTLPRTSSGKIRRAETLQRYRSGELLPPKKISPLRVAGILARSALSQARVARGGRP